jgi:hypothetical protein
MEEIWGAGLNFAHSISSRIGVGCPPWAGSEGDRRSPAAPQTQPYRASGARPE